MQLKFDPSQEHQLKAIESVVELLSGQPKIEVTAPVALYSAATAIANALTIDDDQLLTNLQTVQRGNQLDEDTELRALEARIDTESGPLDVRFPNFSVEMETGTGKTYVYIRTMLTLAQRYGLSKFIVVVPSVAVREGVLKNFAILREHLTELYPDVQYRVMEYDSSNITQVRDFAQLSDVQILVMTLDSFNKASNVIRNDTDRLQGATPIHFIQAARPILILDEPQNMESEKSVAALAGLHPLLALRYSATHKNPYNLAYRLTPYDAYRLNLVKRIEVAGMVQDDDPNQAFVRLDSIASSKKTVTAKATIYQRMADGTVKQKAVTLKQGDSLREKSGGRTEYEGFVVEEISLIGDFVRFENSREIRVQESIGADKEAIFEAQIAYTIEEHFRKQARLRNHGLKVLSLFFIDRVANYADEDGMIRRLFVKAFNRLKAQHPEWANVDVATVHNGYFAQKRKAGVAEYVDSTSGKSREDEAVYDLIMKEKERLLSFDEPLSFIFSHSALREGWDNPNVFQICTLHQTVSNDKKRQEIGRGVRLAVNQEGERDEEPRRNILTVVANESYERYVTALQAETVDEYGEGAVAPPPANARKPKKPVTLQKARVASNEFQELWDKIKHKTRYKVTLDIPALVAKVTPELDKIQVSAPRVVVQKGQVVLAASGRAYEARQASSPKTAQALASDLVKPDLIGTMAMLMEQTTPPLRLRRETLAKIMAATTNKTGAASNPYEFALQAVRQIKEAMNDLLVHGIQYEKVGDVYELELLEEDLELLESSLVPATNSIYDFIDVDSEIERKFVEDLENHNGVRLYVKLPAWFKVPTPVGNYNPDWAIVMEDRDSHGEDGGRPLLYFICETKSTTLRHKLRPDERRKIECGEAHFDGALAVPYTVATSVNELPPRAANP
jgi:type III restriction enzyme